MLIDFPVVSHVINHSIDEKINMINIKAAMTNRDKADKNRTNGDNKNLNHNLEFHCAKTFALSSEVIIILITVSISRIAGNPPEYFSK